MVMDGNSAYVPYPCAERGSRDALCSDRDSFVDVDRCLVVVMLCLGVHEAWMGLRARDYYADGRRKGVRGLEVGASSAC